MIHPPQPYNNQLASLNAIISYSFLQSSSTTRLDYNLSSGTNEIQGEEEVELHSGNGEINLNNLAQIVCENRIRYQLYIHPVEGEEELSNNYIEGSVDCLDLELVSGYCRLLDNNNNYVESINMFPDELIHLSLKCYDEYNHSTQCSGIGEITSLLPFVPDNSIAAELVEESGIYKKVEVNSENAEHSNEFLINITKQDISQGKVLEMLCTLSANLIGGDCWDYV